jgi:hypothetical protein
MDQEIYQCFAPVATKLREAVGMDLSALEAECNRLDEGDSSSSDASDLFSTSRITSSSCSFRTIAVLLAYFRAHSAAATSSTPSAAPIGDPLNETTVFLGTEAIDG